MRWSVRAANEVRRQTAHSKGVLVVARLAGDCRSREADPSSEAGDTTVAEIPELPRVTVMSAVPTQHSVEAAEAGAHAVAVIDDRTLRVIARVAGARIPDGITYVPDAGTPAGKVFFSEESGDVTTVAPSV